jgi:WD40 repeat protein
MARESLVWAVAIDPDERSLAASGADARVTVFTIQAFSDADDRELAEVRNGGSAEEVVPPRIAFAPDGRLLMAGATDGRVRIWDVENPRDPIVKCEMDGHSGSVTGVAFHPTLPIVASASTDQTVIVEELELD